MSLPDFMLDPNVVLKDNAQWRYTTAPDYSLTNSTFEETKTTNWAPDSLEGLVQNLVKNWEKEASYKVNPDEWRTISKEKYTFNLNGGKQNMSADDMLQIGTYSALIGKEGVQGAYELPAMDFTKSHKLFKGAMKTFNWEVLEVLGAPPKVSIRWRHWGKMTGNYRARLNSGRTIYAKANNQLIEVFGVTVAQVNAKFEIESIETFWDPQQMFKQLLSEGIETLEGGTHVEELVPLTLGACPVGH